MTLQSMVLIIVAVVVSILPVTATASQIVRAEDEKLELLTLITGYHSIDDPGKSLQLRILEANGEATVAVNPVTLYLVITNNSSAGDLQQHIWRLPFRVTKVRTIKQIGSGLTVVADAHRVAEVESTERKEIHIIYKFENGTLASTIFVDEDSRKRKD
jgi:hypothetical protein